MHSSAAGACAYKRLQKSILACSSTGTGKVIVALLGIPGVLHIDTFFARYGVRSLSRDTYFLARPLTL